MRKPPAHARKAKESPAGVDLDKPWRGRLDGDGRTDIAEIDEAIRFAARAAGNHLGGAALVTEGSDSEDYRLVSWEVGTGLIVELTVEVSAFKAKGDRDEVKDFLNNLVAA